MNQIEPNKNHLIVRQLIDSSSTDVFYIKAVIRDFDGTVLDTIYLDDKGGQLFTKSWKCVGDNTIAGSGREILISTVVYSDNLYSTLSATEGVNTETFLVQQRISANQVFGGAGGVIDYREIAKIVSDEIKKVPKIEFPKQEFPKQVDFIPAIKDAVKSIVDKIDKIKFPEYKPEKQKEIDFSPLQNKIDNVAKEIRNLPKFERTELFPLIQEIKNLNSTILETHRETMKSMEENSKKLIEEIVAPIQKENARMKTFLSMGLGETPEEAMTKAKNSYLQKLKAKYL